MLVSIEEYHWLKRFYCHKQDLSLVETNQHSASFVEREWDFGGQDIHVNVCSQLRQNNIGRQ